MKTCITKGIVTVSLTAILLSCSSTWAAGKGRVGLAATRLVYSEGEEQISLGVRNTSRMFLIWFSHGWWPQIIKNQRTLLLHHRYLCWIRQTRICYALCTLARRWRKTEKLFSSLAYGQSLQQRSGKKAIPWRLPHKASSNFSGDQRFSVSLRRGSGETALHFVSWHGYGQ